MALQRLRTCLDSVTRPPAQQGVPVIQRIRCKVRGTDLLWPLSSEMEIRTSYAAVALAQAPSAALELWLADGNGGSTAMPVASMADDNLQAICHSSEACAACLRRMHAALDTIEMVCPIQ